MGIVVFNVEGYHPAFERRNATVCDRYPVGIGCQVIKDMLGPFDRIAHIDNPPLFIQPGFELLVLTIGKLKMFTLTGPFHMVDELAAKDQRQGLLVKKILALLILHFYDHRGYIILYSYFTYIFIQDVKN
jgi:hypothetical protein